MNYVVFSIAGLIVVTLLFIVIILLQHQDRAVIQRLNAMEKELTDLTERKHQTGPTMAGLEDVAAALTRIKFERAYENELLNASLSTLGQLRQGPYVYNPDTPCVTKEEIK